MYCTFSLQFSLNTSNGSIYSKHACMITNNHMRGLKFSSDINDSTQTILLHITYIALEKLRYRVPNDVFSGHRVTIASSLMLTSGWLTLNYSGSSHCAWEAWPVVCRSLTQPWPNFAGSVDAGPVLRRYQTANISEPGRWEQLLINTVHADYNFAGVFVTRKYNLFSE